MNIDQFKEKSRTWIVCLTIGFVLAITITEFANCWQKETPEKKSVPVWRPEGAKLQLEESEFFKSYQRGNCELISFESFRAACGGRGTNISVIFQKPDKFHYVFSKDGTNLLTAIKDDYDDTVMLLDKKDLSYDHEVGMLHYKLTRSGPIKLSFAFAFCFVVLAVLPGLIIYGCLHSLRFAILLSWRSLQSWRTAET